MQEQSGAFGEIVYAAAFPGEPLYAVGLAGEDAEVPLGATARPRQLVDADRGLRARGAARASSPEPARVRLCVPTELPDGPDRFEVWRSGSVLALAGDNLFKFAPLLGQRLAAAALGESPRPPAEQSASLASASSILAQALIQLRHQQARPRALKARSAVGTGSSSSSTWAPA